MTEASLQSLFEAQRKRHQLVRLSTSAARIAKLKRLKETIKAHEELIQAALFEDLRKSNFEAAVTELIFTYTEIDFAIQNLRQWMRPIRIGRSASSLFAKNRVIYEPKGVCLIMAPWNYPFQLMMGPLVSAIAAGNCCIIKPSELSNQTSKIIAQIVATTFEKEEVCCLEGNATLAALLLKLPFDHIFFTGSTEVGKKVMQAASLNLSSVTLELGGKSPCVITENTALEQAALKIAWGKLINAGQTCIAPDYVLINANYLDEFIGYYKSACKQLVYQGDRIDVHRYGKIINPKHFERLKSLVSDALEKGARIDFGGNFDEKSLTIAPVLLSRVAQNSRVMEEEIFGPILPVIAYQSLEEAIAFINEKPKPLALYVFGKNRTQIREILSNTSSGGACINDVLIHIGNPKLPFGGVNHSGVGASHGFYGFKNFSHERSVVYQSKFNFNKLIYPPYRGKEWVLRLLKRLT